MLFYSPKAHIRKLWKEIFAMEMKRKKLGYYDSNSPLSFLFDKEIFDRKNLIKSLISCYFDPEEDEEFIHENTPE